MAKYKFDWNKVKEDIVESDKKKDYKDVRFWKPTVDEKGNATAVIRFLPSQDGTPFVKFHTHNFQYMVDGQKKFWIKNCINDFGYDRECPICKKNQEYYNSSFDSDKKIATARKRKLNFVSNILVIKNPAKPEEEGKVFLYNYGLKIYEKIKDKMFPSDEKKALGEGSYDEYIPFDLYEGADFLFEQCKQGEYPNYDKSTFLKQKAVGTDKFIDTVMEQVYDLSEFVGEDKYPSNEEVVKALSSILGLSASTVLNEAGNDTTSPFGDDDIPNFDNTMNTTEQVDPKPNTASESTGATTDDEEADFFKNLR